MNSEDRFTVTRHINGTYMIVGRFNTLEEAQQFAVKRAEMYSCYTYNIYEHKHIAVIKAVDNLKSTS